MSAANTTKSMILCAFFAALTAVCSQILLPLPFTPVPINLATLSVVMSGILLGPYRGVISQAVYVIIGIVGVPVFSGLRGGLSVILGPTGGYILGYISAAFLGGILTKSAGKNLFRYIIAFAAAFLSCYTFGTLWYSISTHTPIAAAILQCVLPFLPGDILKIIAGSMLCKKLKKQIERF